MKFLVPNSEYILVNLCNNDVVHVYSYAMLLVLIIISWPIFASMSIELLYVNNIVMIKLEVINLNFKK